MWKGTVPDARKLYAFLRPPHVGCPAPVRQPAGTPLCALQPTSGGRGFACIKDTKIVGRMQVFDVCFLNFLQASDALCNGCLHEDKRLCLFAYMGLCPYLVAD